MDKKTRCQKTDFDCSLYSHYYSAINRYFTFILIVKIAALSYRVIGGVMYGVNYNTRIMYLTLRTIPLIVLIA